MSWLEDLAVYIHNYLQTLTRANILTYADSDDPHIETVRKCVRISQDTIVDVCMRYDEWQGDFAVELLTYGTF